MREVRCGGDGGGCACSSVRGFFVVVELEVELDAEALAGAGEEAAEGRDAAAYYAEVDFDSIILFGVRITLHASELGKKEKVVYILRKHIENSLAVREIEALRRVPHEEHLRYTNNTDRTA